MHRLRIVLATALACGAPAPTHAGTVATHTLPCGDEEDGERTVAVFTGGPGEANDVTTAWEPVGATLRIRDDGAPLTASGGCRIVAPPHEALCSAVGGVVRTGDGDDRVRPDQVSVDLGEGDDVLDGGAGYGGPGDDVMRGVRLAGGPGADTLTGTSGAFLDGGSGPDRLVGSPQGTRWSRATSTPRGRARLRPTS